MATMTRAQRREPHVKQRRLRKYRERLEHEQWRAQRFLQALEQALVDLRLPESWVAEVEWRLQAQVKLLGKICGLMCPTVFGCRTGSELT
jgi:TPP-dependent pyruvate/acetoin dehydrogenase alpha subunit